MEEYVTRIGDVTIQRVSSSGGGGGSSGSGGGQAEQTQPSQQQGLRVMESEELLRRVKEEPQEEEEEEEEGEEEGEVEESPEEEGGRGGRDDDVGDTGSRGGQEERSRRPDEGDELSSQGTRRDDERESGAVVGRTEEDVEGGEEEEEEDEDRERIIIKAEPADDEDLVGDLAEAAAAAVADAEAAQLMRRRRAADGGRDSDGGKDDEERGEEGDEDGEEDETRGRGRRRGEEDEDGEGRREDEEEKEEDEDDRTGGGRQRGEDEEMELGENSKRKAENEKEEDEENNAKKKRVEMDVDLDKKKISNLRRNIREVMDETQLDESTLAAQRQEAERLRRVQDQQKYIREVQRQIQLNRQNQKTQSRVISLLQGGSTSILKTSVGGSSASSGSGASVPAGPSTVLVKVGSGQAQVLNRKTLEVLRGGKSVSLSGADGGVTGGTMARSGIARVAPAASAGGLSASVAGSLLPSVGGVAAISKPAMVTPSVSIAPVRPSAGASPHLDPGKKEVVTISSSSDSEEDCIVISEGEDDEEEEEEEDVDPTNSGMHTNDLYNIPDEQGRVLINIGKPEDEPEIFLAPQIARVIKPHQIGGVRFLFDNIVESLERFKNSTGFGCILAHSMGLGKTLQVVSFCDVFLRETSARSVMCIMPINTLQNWMSEFNMWLPAPGAVASSPLSVHGEVRARNFSIYVLNDLHKSLSSRAKVVEEWSREGGVLLIGYEMYRQLSMRGKGARPRKGKKKNQPLEEEVDDEKNKPLFDSMYEALVKPGPDLVICDEGHRIKNSHASISHALKQIRTKRRVVLTGYPLQNNLLEYWCMVDFVRPNYLGTKTEFSNMFERPIQNGQCIDSTPQDIRLMRYRAHVLHSLLEGFVQRRSHAVLRNSLPQKEEYVLLVRMTPLQRKLYDTFMNEVVRTKAVPNPLKAFAVCCKIWNHPDILYNFLKKKEMDELQDLDLEETAGLHLSGGVTTSPASASSTSPRRPLAKERRGKKEVKKAQVAPIKAEVNPDEDEGKKRLLTSEERKCDYPGGGYYPAQPPPQTQQFHHLPPEQQQGAAYPSPTSGYHRGPPSHPPHYYPSTGGGYYPHQQEGGGYPSGGHQQGYNSNQQQQQPGGGHQQQQPPGGGYQQQQQPPPPSSQQQQYYQQNYQHTQPSADYPPPHQHQQQDFGSSSRWQSDTAQAHFKQEKGVTKSPKESGGDLTGKVGYQDYYPIKSEESSKQTADVKEEKQTFLFGGFSGGQVSYSSYQQQQRQGYPGGTGEHLTGGYYGGYPPPADGYPPPPPLWNKEGYQPYQQTGDQQQMHHRDGHHGYSQQHNRPSDQQTSSNNHPLSATSYQTESSPVKQEHQLHRSHEHQQNRQENKKKSHPELLPNQQQYGHKKQEQHGGTANRNQQYTSESDKNQQEQSSQQQQSLYYPQEVNKNKDDYRMTFTSPDRSQQTTNYHQSKSNQQQQQQSTHYSLPHKTNVPDYQTRFHEQNQSRRTEPQQQNPGDNPYEQMNRYFGYQDNFVQNPPGSHQQSHDSSGRRSSFGHENPPSQLFPGQQQQHGYPEQHGLTPQHGMEMPEQQHRNSRTTGGGSQQQRIDEGENVANIKKSSSGHSNVGTAPGYLFESGSQTSQSSPYPNQLPSTAQKTSDTGNFRGINTFPEYMDQGGSRLSQNSASPAAGGVGNQTANLQHPGSDHSVQKMIRNEPNQQQMSSHDGYQEPHMFSGHNLFPGKENDNKQQVIIPDSQNPMYREGSGPMSNYDENACWQNTPNVQTPYPPYHHGTVPTESSNSSHDGRFRMTNKDTSSNDNSNSKSITSNEQTVSGRNNNSSFLTNSTPEQGGSQTARDSHAAAERLYQEGMANYYGNPPQAMGAPGGHQNTPGRIGVQEPNYSMSGYPSFQGDANSGQQVYGPGQQQYGTEHSPYMGQQQQQDMKVSSQYPNYGSQSKMPSNPSSYASSNTSAPNQNQNFQQQQQPSFDNQTHSGNKPTSSMQHYQYNNQYPSNYYPNTPYPPQQQSNKDQNPYSSNQGHYQPQNYNHPNQNVNFSTQNNSTNMPFNTSQSQNSNSKSQKTGEHGNKMDQSTNHGTQTSSGCNPIIDGGSGNSQHRMVPSSYGSGVGGPLYDQQGMLSKSDEEMQRFGSNQYNIPKNNESIHAMNSSKGFNSSGCGQDSYQMQYGCDETLPKETTSSSANTAESGIISGKAIADCGGRPDKPTSEEEINKSSNSCEGTDDNNCNKEKTSADKKVEDDKVDKKADSTVSTGGTVTTHKPGKEEPGIPYDWATELLKGYTPGDIDASAKMSVFFCILEESLALGDRILVFSQSLFTLNLIEELLQVHALPNRAGERWAKNVNYYRLDGSTSAMEREKLINEFNSNANLHLFLVSTRAGSLGINLVGANRVIVFDASWNPCHDTQAVCRVYRYGQKKPCFVYRLVTDNCLEKKIYDRQINKQGMSDRVVDECNPDAHLSIKEVTSLCWDDKEDDAEVKDFSSLQDQYIDVVLQKVIQKHSPRLSKEPFAHESLLVDRKEKKLSSAEKRLAKRSYELEKQASTRPLYNPGGLNQGGQVRAKPMASVRPMQTELGGGGAGGRARGWIPASVWQRQGMSAQEMTLPLDVVIPTNSADRASIVLKAGQKVMVLKSPKGIYMQLENGKIIAIRTAFKVGAKKPGETTGKGGVLTSGRGGALSGLRQLTGAGGPAGGTAAGLGRGRPIRAVGPVSRGTGAATGVPPVSISLTRKKSTEEDQPVQKDKEAGGGGEEDSRGERPREESIEEEAGTPMEVGAEKEGTATADESSNPPTAAAAVPNPFSAAAAASLSISNSKLASIAPAADKAQAAVAAGEPMEEEEEEDEAADDDKSQDKVHKQQVTILPPKSKVQPLLPSKTFPHHPQVTIQPVKSSAKSMSAAHQKPIRVLPQKREQSTPILPQPTTPQPQQPSPPFSVQPLKPNLQPEQQHSSTPQMQPVHPTPLSMESQSHPMQPIQPNTAPMQHPTSPSMHQQHLNTPPIQPQPLGPPQPMETQQHPTPLQMETQQHPMRSHGQQSNSSVGSPSMHPQQHSNAPPLQPPQHPTSLQMETQQHPMQHSAATSPIHHRHPMQSQHPVQQPGLMSPSNPVPMQQQQAGQQLPASPSPRKTPSATTPLQPSMSNASVSGGSRASTTQQQHSIQTQSNIHSQQPVQPLSSFSSSSMEPSRLLDPISTPSGQLPTYSSSPLYMPPVSSMQTQTSTSSPQGLHHSMHGLHPQPGLHYPHLHPGSVGPPPYQQAHYPTTKHHLLTPGYSPGYPPTGGYPPPGLPPHPGYPMHPGYGHPMSGYYSPYPPPPLHPHPQFQLGPPPPPHGYPEQVHHLTNPSPVSSSTSSSAPSITSDNHS